MPPSPPRSVRTPPTERLRTYRAKRRFDVTPEPAGGPAEAAAPGWRFVVQKHAARRLHYDVRLELDGVLLSWAVPKGPSLRPGERRLAARTEDHPLEYADFEGVIPADEYGGGTVAVWDRGTWRPHGDPHADLARGRLTFELEGEKLRGRWHLVRLRDDGRGGGKESWLLFKGRDDASRDDGEIVDERPESVVTGRTIEEIAAARDRVWHSSRGRGGDGAPRVAAAGAVPPDPDALHALVARLPAPTPWTNLDKVLYPEAGITKGQIAAYLAVVADWLLPQVVGRPLTLVRCPDGRTSCFYQKHAVRGVPAVVERIPIREERATRSYMLIRDLPGLLALAQLGVLELHPWGCRADQLERPDQVVFDLDPDPAIGWDPVVEAALALKDRLAALGLASFVKTTGGKGLHVVAPIARRLGWDEVKGFARAVAEELERARPDRYTTNPLKARRRGKLFVDYLRNGRGATAIAAYSPRARPGATVATPVTWDELARGIDPEAFTLATVPPRLGALAADPWAGFDDARAAITARARREVGA